MIERPGERAVLAVGVRERGRPPDQGAVRVALHRADAQTVVPERSGEADRTERLELMRQRHADGAQRQPPRVRGRAVGDELSAGDLRVADGRQPGLEERGAGALDRIDEDREWLLRVEVGSVVADVDRDGQDQVHRAVQAEAGDAPVRVAHQGATRRVRGVVGHPPQLQERRVHQHVVPGHVVHDDRMPRRGAIQVPSRRGTVVLRVVEPERADPRALRRRRGGRRDRLHQVLARCDGGVAHVDRGERLAGAEEMVMRVDESGDDGPAADVDAACTGEAAAELVVGAHGEDA